MARRTPAPAGRKRTTRKRATASTDPVRFKVELPRALHTAAVARAAADERSLAGLIRQAIREHLGVTDHDALDRAK